MGEMTAVMTCWKANSFDDVPCKKEVEEFVKCSERMVSCMEGWRRREGRREEDGGREGGGWSEVMV